MNRWSGLHGWSPANMFYATAAVAATLLAGLAAGVEPALLIAGLVGLTVIGTTLMNVTAGLMLFLVVAFLESLPTAAGAPSIAKLVGIFLVLGWLRVVASGRSGARSSADFLSRNAVLTAALCLLIAWILASQIWAEDAAVARTTALRYTLNLVLFPIVFVAIRRPRHLVWLFSVFVASALLVTAVGLQTLGSGGEERLGGGGLNPNELGALLVVAVVLASALACYRPLSGTARLLALLGAGLCAISVVKTESRGSLVGLSAALLVTPFLAGPGRRVRAAAFVMAGALLIAGWLIVVAPQTTLQRVTHASGGSGRVDLWTIGFRMVADRPLTGVGAGNFVVSSIHYLLEPGIITRPQYIISGPKPPHNIYLQVLAELGFVGLALFDTAIILCLTIGFRAARAFGRNGDRDTELLARGLLIALTGLLVADFFSTDIYSKQLYILLALTPPLAAMAARRARSGPAL
ncbi:MAG: O-antigen ligase family protein [Thermoleophilia bacterium]